MVGPLLLNIGILLFDNERRLLIQKLQSVTLLIGKQKNQDFIELSKINDYINTMDSIPEFVTLKNLFESFLNSAKDNPLATALLNGDLSAISNILALGQVGSELLSKFFCKDKEEQNTIIDDLRVNMPALPNTDIEELDAKLKKVQNSITDLKNANIGIDNVIRMRQVLEE